MPSKKKAKSSGYAHDKVFNLFQHKHFTLVFFLATFALIGGAIYLMQSSAAGVKLSGCTVYPSGVRSDFRVYATNKSGAVLGSGAANNPFRIKAARGTLVYASAGNGHMGGSYGYIGTAKTSC